MTRKDIVVRSPNINREKVLEVLCEKSINVYRDHVWHLRI